MIQQQTCVKLKSKIYNTNLQYKILIHEDRILFQIINSKWPITLNRMKIIYFAYLIYLLKKVSEIILEIIFYLENTLRIVKFKISHLFYFFLLLVIIEYYFFCNISRYF